MEKFERFYEKLKFAVDYLKDTDYELWVKVSRYILDGEGKSEILLEAATKISFNKAMSSSAMLLVDIYENEMFQKEDANYPYMIHSVREMITRNMITQESNSSSKRLYAIKMQNGTVKIGIATNANGRFSQIKASSGMNIEKVVYTDIFQNASKEENRLHKKFKSNRLNGEFFSIPFDKAERELREIAEKENIALNFNILEV